MCRSAQEVFAKRSAAVCRSRRKRPSVRSQRKRPTVRSEHEHSQLCCPLLCDPYQLSSRTEVGIPSPHSIPAGNLLEYNLAIVPLHLSILFARVSIFKGIWPRGDTHLTFPPDFIGFWSRKVPTPRVCPCLFSLQNDFHTASNTKFRKSKQVAEQYDSNSILYVNNCVF